LPFIAYFLIVLEQHSKCIAASLAEENLFLSKPSSEYTLIGLPPSVALILVRVSGERDVTDFASLILARVSGV
jgi:hypothetical protein